MLIKEKKAEYDAAVKAATTARNVAEGLELYSETLLNEMGDRMTHFKEDFDKVCEAAIWTTDFEDDYDPEEQWEFLQAGIQYVEHRAQCNTGEERKIARVSYYVKAMDDWLSRATGDQPRFYDRFNGRAQYELQISTSSGVIEYDEEEM